MYDRALRTYAHLVLGLGLLGAVVACGGARGRGILAGAPRERDLPEPFVDEAQLRPDTFGYGARGTALAVVGCDVPIEYALGKLDPRFGLGRKQALAAIATAAASWERLAGRPLFRYSPRSAFKINFVFDERQMMMVERIEGRDPIAEVRRRHTELRAERNRALVAYEERRRAYEASVNTWNQQGGAPPDVKRELDAEKGRLRAEQARLDGMLPRLEALAFFINSRGRSANPAEYPHLLAGQTLVEADGPRVTKLRIEIYMFRGWARLPNVLAHELGHSLRLNHVAAEDSIMYGGPARGQRLSIDDRADLARVCPPTP